MVSSNLKRGLTITSHLVGSCPVSSGASVMKAELFKHFAEANHHGVLKDVSVHVIDRLFGVSRHTSRNSSSLDYGVLCLMDLTSVLCIIRYFIFIPQLTCLFCLFIVDSASILLSFTHLALFASFIYSLLSSSVSAFTTSALPL